MIRLGAENLRTYVAEASEARRMGKDGLCKMDEDSNIPASSENNGVEFTRVVPVTQHHVIQSRDRVR